MDAPNVFSVDWHGLGFDKDDFTPDAFNANKRIFWNEEGTLPSDFPIARCEPDMDWFDGTDSGESGGGGRWFLTFSQVIGRLCKTVKTRATEQLLEFGGPLMCLDIAPCPMIKERDLGDIYYYAVIPPAKVKQLIELGLHLPMEELRSPFEQYVLMHQEDFPLVPTWENLQSYLARWICLLQCASARDHGVVCGV